MIKRISSKEQSEMKIRFNEQMIRQIGACYQYIATEIELVALKLAIATKEYLEKEDLQKVVRGKAARVIGRVESNPNSYVREVTRFALGTSDKRARIESLPILNGVLWPTASVILHFFHSAPYPILDFRALWSVGLQPPAQYTFAFWWEYVRFCPDLARNVAVDMRTLDRALWQYSKENQENV